MVGRLIDVIIRRLKFEAIPGDIKIGHNCYCIPEVVLNMWSERWKWLFTYKVFGSIYFPVETRQVNRRH